ncbi:hypothetical protein AB3S75_008918 [Citrus x aurantiifolia]
MRMSCNGCRILRKGCTDDCIIKPCLDWIKSSDAQANATLFLAKFYGRAGLINLIEAGPQHLRPATFKSLLYEACGRIVDPISGSVGLLWSGKWEQCQAAVDAVLKGKTITQNPSSSSSSSSSNPVDAAPWTLNVQSPPLKIYDIRHVSKDPSVVNCSDKTKARAKQSWNRRPKAPIVGRESIQDQSSWLQSQVISRSEDDYESIFSVETVEGSLDVNRNKQRWVQNENGDVGLELTLCLPPTNH